MHSPAELRSSLNQKQQGEGGLTNTLRYFFRFASVGSGRFMVLPGESGIWNSDDFEHDPGRASLDLSSSLAA